MADRSNSMPWLVKALLWLVVIVTIIIVLQMLFIGGLAAAFFGLIFKALERAQDHSSLEPGLTLITAFC